MNKEDSTKPKTEEHTVDLSTLLTAVSQDSPTSIALPAILIISSAEDSESGLQVDLVEANAKLKRAVEDTIDESNSLSAGLNRSRAVQRIDSTEICSQGSTGPDNLTDEVATLYDGERLEAMRELLEEHKLRTVQQLLASDTGALSPKEVALRNEGIISESTVRDHLRSLTEEGFVEKLEPDVESIPNKMPRTFYAASPLAIELLKEMGLWENLGMLYQLYDSLDRPEDIQAIEEWDERPTPDWLSSQ